ncbi:MAG: hypothetical protein QOG10_2645 [Kribbellaceae bacterium]|jgi:hypothetical protein|nr:hypothetical protein [Kribbellaceae bacterium]
MTIAALALYIVWFATARDPRRRAPEPQGSTR